MNETIGTHGHVPWKPAYRVVYRFVAAYMFLLGCLSLSIVLAFLHGELMHKFVFFDAVALKNIVPWVAVHVLRIRTPITSSMSGDAPFQWVEQFVLLAVAVLAAMVWWVVDRGRPDYRVLDRWLRVFVRLGLAAILFAYGFDKVFPNQFGSITRYDLVQQFGDLSHFNLMWSFMAASKGYTIFSGLLEVLAGVLLVVPELAGVGALLAIVVLANVVALNLAYNIPVKLLSTDFLLMACYLAAPELPRLYHLLVRNRGVAPHPVIALSTNRVVDRGAKIGAMLLGVIFFVGFFFTEFRRYAETKKEASVAVPLQGIWLVDNFAVTGGPQSALFTPKLLKSMRIEPGEERWSKLVMDAPGELVIQTLNGELDYVPMKLNTAMDEAILTDAGDATWKADLKLQQPTPNTLKVNGVVNGVEVSALLHRMDESRFKVRDEGLHLVQPGR